MTAIPLLYWLLAIVCCVSCLFRGDRYGRVGTLLTIAVAIGSAAVTKPGTALAASPAPLLCVDAIYLVSLYGLAVRSHRTWPIWMAGFQLASCLSLLGPLVLDGIPKQLVQGVESFWAIPILGFMWIGIERDRRFNRPPVAG